MSTVDDVCIDNVQQNIVLKQSKLKAKWKKDWQGEN